jgi:hypothetical protein
MGLFNFITMNNQNKTTLPFIIGMEVLERIKTNPNKAVSLLKTSYVDGVLLLTIYTHSL